MFEGGAAEAAGVAGTVGVVIVVVHFVFRICGIMDVHAQK